jgi:pimeloyl-ACP methyl ester carboxylesterase
MFGRFDDLPQFCDAARDRRKSDELRLRMARHKMGQRGLAAPGRPPENHGGQSVGFYRPAQWAVGPDEFILPDEIGKLARTHPLRKWSRLPAGLDGCGKEICGLVLRSRHGAGNSIRLLSSAQTDLGWLLTLPAADATKGAQIGENMKTQVNGITLAYSDRGSGLPIVFLHAFPLNRTMWAAQEAALSSQFRTITIDLRGHGESDAPLWHYTLDQSADDVRTLLDQLSIQQAVFVGLSMGGYILFAFYQKYAERVKGLVLADTRAQTDTLEGKAGRFQMAQTAYKQGPSAIADIMVPKLLSPTTIQTKPNIVQNVRSMIEGNQISGIAGDLMAMAERPDSVPLLKEFTCPTQIIVGGLDQATPPSDAKLMAEQIPGSRLALIPNAAHLSNLEQPEAFNQIVFSFASALANR